MLRIAIGFLLLEILVGCTGSPTSTAESPIIVEPTTVEQAATSQPSTESPMIESTSSSTDLATIQEYPVPAGTHPHDVAPAPDGGTVWYTAQHVGSLGRLDPATG